MSHKQSFSCAGCRALESRLARVERALFSRGETPTAGVNNSPVARSIGDLVTPRQLENIRRGARACGVDFDAESVRLFGCDAGSLTRAAADSLITHFSKLSQSRSSEARA